MPRLLPLLCLATLPAAAQQSAENLAFAEAIRQFLPAAATAMPGRSSRCALRFTLRQYPGSW